MSATMHSITDRLTDVIMMPSNLMHAVQLAKNLFSVTNIFNAAIFMSLCDQQKWLFVKVVIDRYLLSCNCLTTV